MKSTPSIHGLVQPSNENAVGGHAGHKANVFWSKNPRENGLMRGHEVPSDPFFSATGRTPGGPDRRAVNAPQFFVDRAGFDSQCPKASKDFVQCAVGIPPIEATVHRFPRTVFFRQIAPRRSSPQNPKDSIHHRPPVAPWTTGLGGGWKNIRNQYPLIIRKSMSSHSAALRGKVKVKVKVSARQYFAQNLTLTKEQF